MAFVVLSALAGCSSKSASKAPTAQTTPSGARQGASTTALSGSNTSIAGPGMSGAVPNVSASGGVKTLPVTAAVRQSLLDAGAAHHNLASSDYTGLVPGKTYY